MNLILMTSLLLFLNKTWLWQVLIIGLLLMIVFTWKEWQERGKKRFWIRLFAGLIAIVSLAMLALKPVINKETKSYKAVVITEGHTRKQLDSLKRQQKNIKLISYKVNEPLFKAGAIPDTTFIIGNGIKPFDLWQLDSVNTIYLKGTLPKGITRFKYTNDVTVGEQFLFNGIYQKAQNGRVLILKGPGGIDLDSIALKDTLVQPFNLKTDIAVSGKFVFSIQEKDSTGTVLSSDPIPVIANNPKALKILMLNGFPTFESKYLKNYLAEMGHELLIRTQITRGRFKYEYFNRKRAPLSRLTEKNLGEFDLVILDPLTLRNFGGSTKLELKNAVQQDGLGIFVLMNNGGINTLKSFGDFSFKSDGLNEISVLDDSKLRLSKLPISFNESLGINGIHKSKNKLVSAYKTIGNGKIGSSVLQNSYELLLRGNTDEYQQLWSKIIGEISEKESKLVEWNTDSKIAYKDYPFEFGVRTTNDNVRVRSNNEFSIPLKEDIDITNLWHGKTYPKNLGWNLLSTQEDSASVMNYFVTDTLKWRAHNKYRTILENKRFSNRASHTLKKSYISKVISPLWFFFAFMCCVIYLWLEPKVLG
ncbi:hypothetical protein [Spongiivirga citrea]|uniref:Uncharacterized protein n=1 Tax=Spongiivirga citrea TaxID=1481457 RepID=A0A6M0CPN1_9FLAO|nr:hypothetical protein [Spongiivirga citrea]NER15880.1 hypothetical protein [Spongiivirga citrea]